MAKKQSKPRSRKGTVVVAPKTRVAPISAAAAKVAAQPGKIPKYPGENFTSPTVLRSRGLAPRGATALREAGCMETSRVDPKTGRRTSRFSGERCRGTVTVDERGQQQCSTQAFRDPRCSPAVYAKANVPCSTGRFATLTAGSRCPVQLVWLDGTPTLRLCSDQGEVGELVRVSSAEEAKQTAEDLCAHWAAKGTWDDADTQGRGEGLGTLSGGDIIMTRGLRGATEGSKTMARKTGYKSGATSATDAVRQLKAAAAKCDTKWMKAHAASARFFGAAERSVKASLDLCGKSHGVRGLGRTRGPRSHVAAQVERNIDSLVDKIDSAITRADNAAYDGDAEAFRRHRDAAKAAIARGRDECGGNAECKKAVARSASFLPKVEKAAAKRGMRGLGGAKRRGLKGTPAQHLRVGREHISDAREQIRAGYPDAAQEMIAIAQQECGWARKDPKLRTKAASCLTAAARLAEDYAPPPRRRRGSRASGVGGWREAGTWSKAAAQLEADELRRNAPRSTRRKGVRKGLTKSGKLKKGCRFVKGGRIVCKQKR